jgi:Tfp pilus assembly protein PilF/outer membrane receptor protein involved in Fe transport
MINCFHKSFLIFGRKPVKIQPTFRKEGSTMNPLRGNLCRLAAAIIAAAAGCPASSQAQGADEKPVSGEIRIIELQGKADIMPAGAANWYLTQTDQVLHVSDRLRTHENSRVTLLWSDQSVVPFGPLTEIEILPRANAGSLPGLHLVKGIASFFHRDKPGRINVETRTAMAAIEGTEFVMEVADSNGVERSTFSVVDGKVRLSNAAGAIVLTNQQQAITEAGQAPRRTAGFIANNILQWCFYYPAVLDLHDLKLTSDEERELGKSLSAFRAGDLPRALDEYPSSRQAASDDERIYHAALLLAVGEVDQTEAELAALPSHDSSERLQRLANALRTLIAAVKRQPASFTPNPQLATEFLAASYFEQSRALGDSSLAKALAFAQQATRISPQFGFASERVAELEFSFGQTEKTLESLNQSLEVAPQNAQALALKGFLLAARNQTTDAIGWFNRAIAVDAALGNAWLGRGLCRIRRGDAQGGREDLLVAAALEPQRAVLRSYLGKAYADAGDDRRATNEFQRAINLDPNDPTAWLYSALLKQRENRINAAIRDLEHSELLNDNRTVYRSRLMLDQDAAVRGANLASIYRDAGMVDVSEREATRAVNFDYANYSAHLFLADSYNQLRDPNQINLRYETPWLSEFLLANLLAPVGAGTLSQTVSQQEYSKLFEHDRFGVASSTEYLSRGAWIQSGSQYGTYGNFGYAVDSLYRSDNGQQPNGDQDQLTLSLQLKEQLTSQDSVYLQTIYYNDSFGDLAQYYNQNSANTSLRGTETQEPLLLLGYHHEWKPGVHSLVIAGRFDDKQNVSDANQPVLLLGVNGAGQVIAVPTPALPTAPMNYQSKLTLYSAEAQQIFEQDEHSLIFGLRGQTGAFDTDSALGRSTPAYLSNNSATTSVSFATAPISQSQTTDFERFTAYGYYFWRILEPLQLVGGLSYDYMWYPQNFRAPPVSSAQSTESRWSPKAGFTWTPLPGTTVRFAYTRSLGGVSFDQSVRLEPTQVAGFNQAFRSLIPESVAGSVSGAKFETYGLALDQKFKTGTYFSLQGNLLFSDANQTIGVVNLNFPPAYTASGTAQNLNYTEKDLIVTVNQLLGNCWSVGARDELSDAELETSYPGIPDSVTTGNHAKNSATLNELSLFVLFNHPSGFFARAEGNWFDQSNRDYQPALPGDEFWQFNLYAGYRFWHRRAQAELGVLNLTDQNYHLNPLNLYTDLPRTRTFYAGLQFNF